MLLRRDAQCLLQDVLLADVMYQDKDQPYIQGKDFWLLKVVMCGEERGVKINGGDMQTSR